MRYEIEFLSADKRKGFQQVDNIFLGVRSHVCPKNQK